MIVSKKSYKAMISPKREGVLPEGQAVSMLSVHFSQAV
jgi:hypothetical protein